MKRHFRGLNGKKSESYIQEEIAFEFSAAATLAEQRNKNTVSSSIDVDSYLINSCRKCNCISMPLSSSNSATNCQLPSFNPNSIHFCKRSQRNQIKMRLKEKSKKRLESKKQAPNSTDESIMCEDLEVSSCSQVSVSDLNEAQLPSEFVYSSGTTVKSKNKPRCNSANSEFDDDVCTLKRDCRCKLCLHKMKIADELIAEEESSKKKKPKKKKKNRSTSQQNTSIDGESLFQEEESSNDNHKEKKHDDNKRKDVIESVKSERKSNKTIDNETLMNSSSEIEELQWIKVKNKYAKHSFVDEWDDGNSGSECSARASESSNFNSEFDMESNGFKLINNDKRRNSNNIANRSSEDLCLNKEMDTLNLNDNSSTTSASCSYGRLTSNNTACSISATQKAKILLIEANLCFERNEIKEAIRNVSLSIELDPKNPDYLLSRSFFYESINNFEDALKDAEAVLELDDAEEYFERALYCKAKSLNGLFQYDECETTLNTIKVLHDNSLLFALEKDLRLVRLKKLLYCNYDLALARLYSEKFKSITDAMNAIQNNCKILKVKKSDETDVCLHMELIKFQTDNQIINDNKWENFILPNNKLPFQIEFESDDDDIFVSDDDEYDLFYGNTENIKYSKESLIKQPKINVEPKDTNNSKGQKALWIGNVSPACSLALATNIFAKYGNVTFCKIFPNEKTNELAYLLLHFDNDISPQIVMKQFKDKYIEGISKDHLPLVIRYRNKNDKDESSEFSTNQFGMQSCPTTPISVSNGLSNAAGSSSSAPKSVSECYYWRTTGCDRERCQYKHIPSNKGIDRQAWMRRKN